MKRGLLKLICRLTGHRPDRSYHLLGIHVCACLRCGEVSPAAPPRQHERLF
jgi:hypothetical protein